MNALPYENDAETVALLRELGTFDPVEDKVLSTIVRGGRVHTLPHNWSLIWERTPPDKAYVVLRGEVAVRLKGEQIARLGPGDIVGELAIMGNRLRSATVVAASDLEVLHFTKDEVEALYAGVPAFREAFDRAAEAHVA